MPENQRSAKEIIAEVRAIARDMAIYRPDPGELLPSIKDDIRDFLSLERSPFKTWLDDRQYLTKPGTAIFNRNLPCEQPGERVTIQVLDRIVDTPAGKLCAAISISLMLADWKALHPEWTPDRAEQELREAARQLPGLCDQLELATGGEVIAVHEASRQLPKPETTIGPIRPQWLRAMFDVEDNRTLKELLGNSQDERTERKWYVSSRRLEALGDWKQILRDAAERMPVKEKKSVESFLSLH